MGDVDKLHVMSVDGEAVLRRITISQHRLDKDRRSRLRVCGPVVGHLDILQCQQGRDERGAKRGTGRGCTRCRVAPVHHVAWD